MFEYILDVFGLFMYALQLAGGTSASCMGAFLEEYLVQFSAVQRIAVQCSAVQCCVVQCTLRQSHLSHQNFVWRKNE